MNERSDAEVVSVRVNGRIFEDWSTAQVTRAMTAAAASFAVAAPWWLPRPGEPLFARPGDGLTVEIGGAPVVTGYIDAIDASNDPDRAGVRISGRSKAGDLVDCDAIVKSGQLRGLDLLAVARTLCKPFGIGVAVDPGISVGKKFDLVEIEQGETVDAVLVRLARERGLLKWSTSDGGIVFGRGSRGRAAVALVHRLGPNGEPVEGNNVLTITGKFSAAGRFSEVLIKGQQQWSLDAPAIKSAQPKGRAVDAGINRYRPKVINAENAATPSAMQRRAEWEVARRIGAASQVTASVDGWRQTPEGDLWDIGLTVRVISDMLNLDGDLIVAGVTFRVDGGALRCDLTLEPPEAHAPQPAQAKAAGGGQFASIRQQTQG